MSAEDELCDTEFEIRVCGSCGLVHLILAQTEIRLPAESARKIAEGLMEAAEMAEEEALGEVVEAA